MSSSASQNDKEQVYTYKGRVFHTKNFSTLCNSDPELQKIADAFAQFWKNGYHPDFGKNAAFARPAEILNLHVRHSHVDTKNYTPEESDKNIRGKESAWDAWRNIGSVAVRYAPTSDSFLIYSVNEKRDALVMFFVDENAHSSSEKKELTESMISISYKFFEQTKTKEMPLDEDLFSDKWKN
ncbi:hypothetical protein ACG1VR_10550 [Cedecea davisae]|uniref:hypothetical protein n=1 Tax=Cedecea davisae TaxID=158484 RepID=UPI00376EB3F3